MTEPSGRYVVDLDGTAWLTSKATCDLCSEPFVVGYTANGTGYNPGPVATATFCGGCIPIIRGITEEAKEPPPLPPEPQSPKELFAALEIPAAPAEPNPPKDRTREWKGDYYTGGPPCGGITHPSGATWRRTDGSCPWCEDVRPLYVATPPPPPETALVSGYSSDMRSGGRRVRPPWPIDGPGSAMTGDGDWSLSVRQHGFFGRNEHGDLMGGCW